MMSERDYDNIIYTARTEGIAEGRAEGRAEGMAEGEAKGRMEERGEMARMMKAKGLEISLISEMTGLSEEEIRKL